MIITFQDTFAITEFKGINKKWKLKKMELGDLFMITEINGTKQRKIELKNVIMMTKIHGTRN